MKKLYEAGATFMAALREIFDEAAYRRFLQRTGRPASRSSPITCSIAARSISVLATSASSRSGMTIMRLSALTVSLGSLWRCIAATC